MRKSYKIFLAFLLSFTILITMGTAGFVGFAEEEAKVEEPSNSAPIVEEPEIEAPEVKKPEVGEPEVEEPEVEKPETGDEDNKDEANDPKDTDNEGKTDEADSADDVDHADNEDESNNSDIANGEEKTDPEKPGEGEAMLTVTHILSKEGVEEEISIETLEGLKIGALISIDSLILDNEIFNFLGDPLEEVEILEGENNISLYYEMIKESTKTRLIITHILIREDGEEIISTNTIENIEAGITVFKDTFKLKDDNLIYLGNSQEEYTVEKGLNKISLYYERKPEEIIIEYTDLTINHIVTFKYQADDVMTETIENLEVGTAVYSSDYIINQEGIEFVRSDGEEILLGKGTNTINLYYKFLEDEYTPEDSDFPFGEGETIESSYIEEFSKGSLGPFIETHIQDFKKLKLMESESYPDEVNNKIWPNPGSLKLNKTGEAIEGKGNQWEITLDIEGKDSAETSDIVLVIDRSGSMKGNKIEDATDAARDFVETLLNNPNKTHVRIAIVSFAGDVRVDSEFKNSLEKDSLLLAIDGIKANGGTHIQAGLRQANALLYGSEADYKNIILLGDGAATYSFKPNNPNSYLESWKTSWFRSYYRTSSNIPESGFNYDVTVGNGNSEYTEYELGGSFWNWTLYSNSYRHGAHAIAEAGFGKSAGYEMYSIALDAGAEGDWTLEEIASPGNYYPTPYSGNLNKIFKEIAGRLSSAATNAKVTDPLGDMYDILGINASNYNDLITVSHGTIDYDTTNDTITWDIGTIDEGENYWMKYTVTLDYSAEGGVLYPANKPTYIDYKNIDEEIAKKYFPIPKFRLRSLTLTKFVTNGDSDKEFDIILEGPVGPYSKTWAVSLKDGESKTIKGLLPGSYTIKETVPMNYEAVKTINISIGEDDWTLFQSITNTRNNDGWFYHEDELVNTFGVGVVQSRNNTSKKEPSHKNSQNILKPLIEAVLPEEDDDLKNLD